MIFLHNTFTILLYITGIIYTLYLIVIGIKGFINDDK